jgi:hypothetical protein
MIKDPSYRAGTYQILCKNCTKLNLITTKRQKSRETKGHDRAISLNHSDLTAVAKHCLENNQQRSHSKLIKKTVSKSWEMDAWESLFIH